MDKYILVIDSNSEIPYQYADKYDLKVIYMPYFFDGEEEELYYDLGRKYNPTDFFDKLKSGKTTITVQKNPHHFIEMFDPYLEQGLDIVYLGFSSKFSGTFNNAMIAREELLKTYPQRRIELIDSSAISVPLTQIVLKAAQKREEGASIDELVKYVNDIKYKFSAIITVNDLTYLRRGGRLSGSAAFFGSVLNIKPIIRLNREGRLVPADKVKGRKKAMSYLVEDVYKNAEDTENNILIIAQADCQEDAIQLKNTIAEKMNFKEIWIHNVGPVIGSHCGPGTLAVSYYGKERED